jgi:hypothetical protein
MVGSRIAELYKMKFNMKEREGLIKEQGMAAEMFCEM